MSSPWELPIINAAQDFPVKEREESVSENASDEICRPSTHSTKVYAKGGIAESRVSPSFLSAVLISAGEGLVDSFSAGSSFIMSLQ